jgi:hypothetical protein
MLYIDDGIELQHMLYLKVGNLEKHLPAKNIICKGLTKSEFVLLILNEFEQIENGSFKKLEPMFKAELEIEKFKLI